MLKWLLISLAALVGLVLLIVLIGALLPKDHQATASITLDQPADSVWSLVRNLGSYADWWDQVETVERLPDRAGLEAWEQRDRRGERMPIEVVEAQPPRRLVTRIADETLPFGGTWTFEIAETGGGCTLTLTEDGEVRNPVFRFMARFVFGHHATIESFLRAVGRRFGQPVTIQRLPSA